MLSALVLCAALSMLISRAFRFVARTSHVQAHTHRGRYTHTEKMLLHKRAATFSAQVIVLPLQIVCLFLCSVSQLRHLWKIFSHCKKKLAFDRFSAYVFVIHVEFFLLRLFCHTFTQTWLTVRLQHTLNIKGSVTKLSNTKYANFRLKISLIKYQ